jgi:fibro-slime domain-containing protein
VEDSLIVPVTYYDYHANGSCPDFQKAGLNSVYLKNMVLRDTLDSERKPVGSYSSFWTNTGFRTCLYSGNGCLSGTPPDWKAGKSWSWWCNCYYNYTSGDFPTGGCEYKSTAANRNWYFSDNINQWFRPFGAPTARFDTLTGKWTNLLYDAAMKAYYGADVAARRAAGDTAMINMVVYDSLIWVRDTTYNPNDKNTYVYGKLCDTSCYTFCGANRTSVRKPSTPAGEYWQEFFHPLKGRGFGYDGPWSGTVGKWGSTAYASWGDFKNQNFSFAMELHRKFVADTGQIFVFRGNDDLWVFVKDSLIMDQGGIHMPVSDTVKVSNLVASGFLTRGTEYWFDLFYCERNGWGSEILMATNMMWYDAGQATQRRWKRDYGFLD